MPRPEGAPPKLGEILGGKAEQMPDNPTMDNLPDMLGELAPDIEYTTAGKMKLLNLLKRRFGDNFQSIGPVKSMLKDFEDEMKVRRSIRKNINLRKEKK